MAKPLNDNIAVNAPKPIDSRYLNGAIAFISVASANSAITLTRRYPGLTVLIGSTEYWYKGGIDDVNLVVKVSGGGAIFPEWDWAAHSNAAPVSTFIGETWITKGDYVSGAFVITDGSFLISKIVGADAVDEAMTEYRIKP